GPRDLTVPIVEDILESRLPGLEQAIHAYGRVNVKTATLSRLCVGKVKNSIVVCLPGSPSAVSDGLDVLLPTVFHSFHMMRGEQH
ncbi:MAG: bifunctional molybdenum cofactor biosynthesis protein MoaC/MoaB, partial [Gammaproteobacteria bacterium]|nr:bifunctional molybdenum cofactor biosynthesis protein MoaC/MoaB [Gammaproteobacteria bacterium]